MPPTDEQLIVEFAKQRQGWRIDKFEPGQWYAWHPIVFHDTTYHLRFYPSAISDDGEPRNGRDFWCASLVSADLEQFASYSGTYAEVTAEIRGAERLLDLAHELSACRTREAAWPLVENVRGQQLELLRRIVGVPRSSADRMRQAIVNQTCGFRIDHDVILNRKW